MAGEIELQGVVDRSFPLAKKGASQAKPGGLAGSAQLTLPAPPKLATFVPSPELQAHQPRKHQEAASASRTDGSDARHPPKSAFLAREGC